MDYTQNFDNNAHILAAYGAPADALDGAEVLLAWASFGNNGANSLVIFQREDVLYEVQGGRIEGQGLTGQWRPVETSWDALAQCSYTYGGHAWGLAATAELQDLVKSKRVG